MLVGLEVCVISLRLRREAKRELFPFRSGLFPLFPLSLSLLSLSLLSLLSSLLPPSGTTSKCDPVIQRLGTRFVLVVEEAFFPFLAAATATVPLPLIRPLTLPTASVVTSMPAPTIHFLISAAAFWCEGLR